MLLPLRNAPWLLGMWSDECNRAVQQQLLANIDKYCGPDFGVADLLLMIGAGGAAVMVVFWKEVAQFLSEKVEGKNK